MKEIIWPGGKEIRYINGREKTRKRRPLELSLTVGMMVLGLHTTLLNDVGLQYFTNGLISLLSVEMRPP